jgi:predicted dehydrogenase
VCGFVRPHDPDHRLFAPGLGGGALLDLGIYPLQLSALVLGPPTSVAATAHLGPTGVDEQVAAVLGHEGGGVATVRAALRSRLACTARISGTDGWIGLPAFMHCPDHLVVETDRSERIDCPFEGTGLQHEIAEVQRCLTEGLLESPLLPQAETLRLARTMDEVRAAIGLTYPDEEVPAIA